MVGRKPGGPKTGARKPGTPNKKTQTLIEKCEARGLDLFDAFLELIQDENADPSLRFNALKEAAQYVFPKRKAIEHSGEINQKLIEEAERLQGLDKEDLKKVIQEELKK